MHYLFEDFSLDTERRELRCDGGLVSIEPKVFDLLVHLIANRERVVSKDDLVAAIWGGRIVSEAALTTCVNAVRRAVGDDGKAQRWIKTLPRKGFRFVGDVREERDPKHPGVGEISPDALPLALPDRPSVAVLPFANLSDDPEQEYFADGMVEDIITGLSRFRSLFVIARNSTFAYKGRSPDVRQVGRELGVRYVLEGSVRKAGVRVRITGQLVDAANGVHLWADRFDGELANVFALQDHVASSVVGIIAPKVDKAESARVLTKPTESLDAYDSLLRALSLLYALDNRQFSEAGSYLRRAVTLDPSYAQAYAYLAWWLNLKRGDGRSDDLEGDARQAIDAALRAVDLDPEDAFNLAVAGHIQGFLNKNLDAAVELFERALQLNENSAFAWGISASTYCFLGQADEAFERLRKAWRLSPFDPLNFWFCTVAGLAEFVAGRYDQAIGWLRKAQRINPRFSACLRTLTASLALAGDLDAARPTAQQVLAIEPGFRVSVFASWYPLRPRDLERLTDGLRLAGLPA